MNRRLAALAMALASSGCTQAFVEARHERGQYGPPESRIAIGARWFFWDAYGDWLAEKIRRETKP